MMKTMSAVYMVDQDADEVDEDASWIEKLLARRVVRIIMFCIMIGYGIFGVVFDWLWVADTLQVSKALVFGPPGTDIVATLILVASIGTISFIFEVVNTILKWRYDKTIIAEEYAELITLFVEEVPQTTLNVLLASCREVPISYYQLVKAGLAMFGSLFRSIRVLARYLTARRRGARRGLLPFLIRTVILGACVYIMIACILVWIFTYRDNYSGGHKVPENIYTKAYDDGRYLYKSSVYFSHPIFSMCNGQTAPWNETRSNWIKMESIYGIQDSDDAQFDFFYEDGRSVTHVHTAYPDIDDTDLYFETIYPNCTTEEVDENIVFPPNFFRFVFGSKDRDKTRVFGDITFEAIVEEIDTCNYLVTDDWGFLRTESSNEIYAQFQYLRIQDELNDTYPFYEEKSGLYRPYLYGKEESQNVTEVWKTGYNECDMTGSLTPNLDRDLHLECTV